jgi:hypothetical protein
MAMNKLFTVGLGGIVLVVHWMPAIAQPLKFDPVEFDAAPLPYMSSATGGSAVAIVLDPTGGDGFEIKLPARFEAKANGLDHEDGKADRPQGRRAALPSPLGEWVKRRAARSL